MDVDNGTVLIIDDEENIRHMLSIVLAKEGFRCTIAAQAQEGLELLRKQSFDIVLCDVNMPKMTGLDLLAHIGQEGIDSTVIMITAYGSVEGAIEAIQAGAYDYINKPFRPDEVLLTIRKAQERERLRRENRELRRQLNQEYDFSNIVSEDPKMQSIFGMVRKIAGFKSTVLIEGESGTGKELIARALHHASDRAEKPFIPLNCGAIPEHLIESELFGHERGAFTDAVRSRNGLFLEADGGTLFLDEVGELPYSLQVKLLRVLQEEEIRRVGSDKSTKIDVRIITANIAPLEELVKKKEFREDLYYRLNVLPVRLPPLRDRHGDIPLLVTHFIRRFNARLGLDIESVNEEALRLFERYHWPGNVRELEHTLERAMILADEKVLTPTDLPGKITEHKPTYNVALSEDELSIKKATYRIENDLIRKALTKTKGNRTAAAKLLEISHRALLYKIKEYEIDL